MDLYEHIFEAAPDGMLLIGADGRVSHANAQADLLFGYPHGTLVGRSVDSLVPDRLSRDHAAHRNAYAVRPCARPMGAGLSLHARRADGTEIPVDIMLSPIGEGESMRVLCVVRNITERVRAQQKIVKSLREKEVLLKEVRHRVKNNLAVIASLFYLQSTYVRDEPTLRILQECQDRVRSMALVHESLYGSEDHAAVDFADYAHRLAAQLVAAYSLHPDQVSLETDLQYMPMGVDLAIPCGLILNELVSNALKHAFPGERRGLISLNLRQEGDLCTLSVKDNGVGIAGERDIAQSPSLGLRIIQSLVRQIDGEFEILPASPGTLARLSLPVSRDEPAH